MPAGRLSLGEEHWSSARSRADIASKVFVSHGRGPMTIDVSIAKKLSQRVVRTRPLGHSIMTRGNRCRITNA
ncbi:unnamed protein product [Peniophora sp. CBMAI 1063]|nr:unnamed protein product [Peniophora sp. CBMAI 1063]